MSNYNFRRDIRTDDQFKQDIKTFTKFEKKCMIQYFEQEILPVYPNAKLIDNGTDNSGGVNEGNVKGDEDFLIQLTNEKSILVEVKASPSPACVTLKDHCITRLLNSNSYVLLVLDGRSQRPDFVLCKSSDVIAFREKGLYNDRDSKFGNKSTFRLYSKDVFNIKQATI